MLLHPYTIPVADMHWKVEARTEVSFTWDYEARSDELLKLYAKGKHGQWAVDTRIDWSLHVDPDDPMQFAEEMLPLYGTPLWHRMSARHKSDLRYHSQVHELSQFLHGEQGALICAAKIVQEVPSIEAKLYAATQVMDEARHVEVFRRLLDEKFRFVYPITLPLATLIQQALSDRRWDFTYLAMQVLIEGLALTAFQRNRDYARNALCAAVNAYVMQDEARHVAFGRLALRHYYPQLSPAERAEREDFVIASLYHIRDRLNALEMWERIGLDVKDVLKSLEASVNMLRFRKRLFSRIVPTVRDIGLWSTKVEQAFAELGALEYVQKNATAMLEEDDKVAEEFDRLMKEGWRGERTARKQT
jgi:hypothetical protein